MKNLLTLILILSFFASAKAQKGINLIENAKTGAEKENLGDSINSTAGELLPLISADGKTLLFCRNNHPENSGSNDEDIWSSTWNEKGYWEKAVNVGKPLNNEGNNSVFGLSPDGNSIFVMSEYYPNGLYKGGGISISGMSKDGWYVPSKINMEDYYNNSHFANYCLSPGQNVMLMALNRKETQGGSDLWVSFRKDEFNWTKPLNIGNVINSTEHEASPFLAADNKTLYFASNGHKGYGSFDLFVTKRLDNTWTNWSEPKNLGPEINTKQLDAFYTIPASGDYAYMVSEENSFGGTDIFRIKLPESAKPEAVILVYGKISYTDGTPIAANIIYTETGSSNEGIASSNPTTGKYKIVVPIGKKYEITFSGKTIQEKTVEVDVTKYTEYAEIERNYIVERKIILASLEDSPETTETNPTENLGGDIYHPSAIYFDYNVSTLSAKAKSELNKVSAEMEKIQNLKLNLQGHTDSKGDNEYNIALGKRRTLSAKKYLESKGISADRIKILSFGEEKPAKSNKESKGRALNRRVEMEWSK